MPEAKLRQLLQTILQWVADLEIRQSALQAVLIRLGEKESLDDLIQKEIREMNAFQETQDMRRVIREFDVEELIEILSDNSEPIQ